MTLKVKEVLRRRNQQVKYLSTAEETGLFVSSEVALYSLVVNEKSYIFLYEAPDGVLSKASTTLYVHCYQMCTACLKK